MKMSSNISPEPENEVFHSKSSTRQEASLYITSTCVTRHLYNIK